MTRARSILTLAAHPNAASTLPPSPLRRGTVRAFTWRSSDLLLGLLEKLGKRRSLVCCCCSCSCICHGVIRWQFVAGGLLYVKFENEPTLMTESQSLSGFPSVTLG